MATVCGASAVTPRPLVPVPSEARFSTALQLFAPAVLVSSRNAMALLLLCAPASMVMLPPLPTALPVTAAKLAFRPSVKLQMGAVLVMDSAACKVPPTRWLGKVTGFGVTPAAARL